VGGDARGINATQFNMAGTGIGTFSDRLRDAARGGSPFGGQTEQGFLNGLYIYPNETEQGSDAEQLARLQNFMDIIRLGLAGNLSDFSFVGSDGSMVTGSDISYNGSPAGYTADPQEQIVYISKHPPGQRGSGCPVGDYHRVDEGGVVIAVDLFSGVGGFTTGAKLAGVRVGAAVDSWRDAVEAHLANHREVIHHEADLTDFDFDELPTHDLLLASPPCQGFSEASQPTRRPKHAKDRFCAWSVVHAAGECRPTTILVENVPGIQQWDKYQEWLASFQALGYHTWEHVFDTADFGVPQNRKRFILTARLGQVLALTSPALPHRPFRDYVDLCLPSVAVSG
jgi:hypothetical protein